MTIEILEKANEIRDEFNTIVDLETLFRNASIEGAKLIACRDDRVLNECTLWPEITAKLVAVLHDEEERLNAELEAL